MHLVLYGTLSFLIARALDDPAKANRLRAFLSGFVFCVAMGAADEWHQLYIPGRSAEVADWMADSTGGLVGAVAWMLRSRQKGATYLPSDV